MTPTTPPPSLRACGIRVPCSTSNLGAGFDCLGLALDLYLDAGYEPGSGDLTIRRAGTLRDLTVKLADDRLVLAFLAELSRRGIQNPGGMLLTTSSIPVARGLGSSAAATVAGIALAVTACGDSLDRDAALAAAMRVEGHPDNAAPALFGGLMAIAGSGHGVPHAMRLPLSGQVSFVFAAPAEQVSTTRARTVLPQHVPHSAAARNLGRMAALLHGLATADAESIAIGFSDELHVPYRLPLIPRAAAALKAAMAAGAWGATISGSGSGLIAACAADAEAPVAKAMEDAFGGTAAGARAYMLRPDMHGAQPRDVGTLRDALRSAS
ncbi:MAG TPA: homoserine kinase [Longimicrobiales bacterium]|nr:homoserine kinase [Longimicrobiales bacterium]